jgi:hypothetical protein
VGAGTACVALVVWLVWYRETTSIPKLIDAFSKSHKQSLETFERVMKEEREQCQRRLDALASLIHSGASK